MKRVLMAGVACLSVAVIFGAAGSSAMAGGKRIDHKGVGPNASLVIVVEDPFVQDNAILDRLRRLPCSTSGAQKLLPDIRIFVEGGCVLNGRLGCFGNAIDHRFFGRVVYPLEEGTEEVPMEIVFPGLKIDHHQSLQTKDGTYIYVYYDPAKNRLRLEQSVTPHSTER